MIKSQLQTEDEMQNKKMVRFDPTLTSGTLIEILVILAGIGGLYNTITNQQARTAIQIEYMNSVIDREKDITQKRLTELKDDVKDVQKALVNLEVTLARSQPGVMGALPRK